MATGTEISTAMLPDYGQAVVEKLEELTREGKVKSYAVNGQAKYEFTGEGLNDYTTWLHTFVLDQAQTFLMANLSN